MDSLKQLGKHFIPPEFLRPFSESHPGEDMRLKFNSFFFLFLISCLSLAIGRPWKTWIQG